MTTWKEVRNQLELSSEEEAVIALEKSLIETLVKIREEKDLFFKTLFFKK